MRRVFATVGFAGFGLSAVLHVITFFGIDLTSAWPGLWLILILPVLALLPAVLWMHGLLRSEVARDPYGALFGATELKDAETNLQDLTNGVKEQSERAERELVRRLRPRPLVIGFFFIAVYAALNFVISLSLLDGGVPEQRGDSFELMSHGKTVRELTASEYRWCRAYQTRLATGHLMFFLFAAGVLCTMPRREPH